MLSTAVAPSPILLVAVFCIVAALNISAVDVLGKLVKLAPDIAGRLPVNLVASMVVEVNKPA